MANKDVAVGLNQLTGYYKGHYYENGRVLTQPKPKPEMVRVPPEDASLYEIFSRYNLVTEDLRRKMKRRR